MKPDLDPGSVLAASGVAELSRTKPPAGSGQYGRTPRMRIGQRPPQFDQRTSLCYACSPHPKQDHERYNMSMHPEVRVYSDPFEGLKVQLSELRGLIKIVPPLIEADRERRWREIGQRPSDGEDDEVIDIYEAEAGPEEGWGFADFGRTIRVAAVVFAWAVFQDYLAHELKDDR